MKIHPKLCVNKATIKNLTRHLLKFQIKNKESVWCYKLTNGEIKVDMAKLKRDEIKTKLPI